MAYSKTNWVNGQTPINETNLNKIENELETLDYDKDNLENKVNNIEMDLNKNNNYYGGLAKRSVRDNSAQFTIQVPNPRTDGYIRKLLLCCGDKGIAYISFTHSSNTANVIYKTFNQTLSVSLSNNVLTFQFGTTIYGGISALFLD